MSGVRWVPVLGLMLAAAGATARPLPAQVCPAQPVCPIQVEVTAPVGPSRDCQVSAPAEVTLDDQTTTLVWELKEVNGALDGFAFGNRVAGARFDGIVFRVSGHLFRPRGPQAGGTTVVREPFQVPRRTRHPYDVHVQFTSPAGLARDCRDDLGPVIVNRGE